MRHVLAALLILLLASPAAAAPALWRVADEDTEIILFGTLHMLPADAKWLDARIGARLDAADTLVLEAVLPASPYAMQRQVQLFGVREGLPALRDRVAEAKRPALDAAVALSGLPPAALDRMETWLAAVALSSAALGKLGLKPELGAEAVLRARAEAGGTPVVGLETPEQQLGFFDALPEADQRALLEATLDEVGEAKAETTVLLARWQAGDVEAIGRDVDSEMRATPGLAAVLLTRRNARWAEWIAGVLRSRPGKVFVAVGAGHLTGADSVQAALAAKGLTVERLP